MLGQITSSLLVLTMFCTGGRALAVEGDSLPERPAAGIDFSIIDTSVGPQDNFYRFANGHWLDRETIPPGVPRLNTYSAMQADLARALVRVVVGAAAIPGPPADHLTRQVGLFFASGMDTEAVDAAGLDPIAPELALIESISDAAGLGRAVARLQACGVEAFVGIHEPRYWEVDERHEMFLRQGGLGLPDPSDYLDPGRRAAYLAHLETLFVLAGDERPQAVERARAAVQLESLLAERWEPATTDPRRRDRRRDFAAIDRDSPGLDWSAFLLELGVPRERRAVLRQPDYFRRLGRLTGEVSPGRWRPYLRACLLRTAAPLLDSRFVAEHDRYRRGAEPSPSRRERVAAEVERRMPWAVGELYRRRYFDAGAEQAARDLVGRVKSALIRLVGDSEHFGKNEKEWQLRKLAAIEIRIGGPGRVDWITGLDLKEGAYLRNAFAVHEHRLRHRLARLGRSWDRSRWNSLPQSLDAINYRGDNHIEVVASLWQPPVFDPQGDPAANLGMIGSTVAHELIHAIDREGRRFGDEGGGLRWWQRRSARRFDRETGKLVARFDAFEVVNGRRVDGRGTLMENTADLAGLAVAFEALRGMVAEGAVAPEIDGFTPQQRFFLAYAQKKKELIREDALAASLSGPHAPSRCRVVGPLPTLDAFIEAFGVRPGHAMYVEERDRVRPW